MTQEEQRDTQETEALEEGAVSFERADTEAIGDPAVASVDADPGPIVAEPAFADPVPPMGEPGAEAEQSPAAADRRGAEQAESPPFVQIGAAFVGAFAAAKLLGKLGGGDD
jgi:hypothetical protein